MGDVRYLIEAELTRPDRRPSPVPQVHLEYAGSQVVAYRWVRDRLGAPAFSLWVALMRRRDFNGLCRFRIGWLRVRWLDATEGATTRLLSAHQVERALSRLRAAGLVKGERAHRYLFGDYRNGLMSIPGWSRHLLERLPHHGGKRKGAGRKSMKSTPPEAQKGAKSTPVRASEMIGPIELAPAKPARRTRKQPQQTDSNHSANLPIKSRRRPNQVAVIIKGDKVNSSSEEEELLRRSPQRVSDFSEEVRPPPAAEVGLVIVSTSPPRVRIPPFHTTGTQDAAGRWLIPPQPTIGRLGAAMVPPPPQLDPSADEAGLVRALLAAYRGAQGAQTGRPSFVLRKGLQPTDPRFGALARGGQALRERGIAPAAWAAFSLRVWRDYADVRRGRSQEAPVRWVFEASRVAEREGWFRREAGGYGGRLVLGNQLRDLIARHDGMVRALRLAGGYALTADQTQQIVAVHWPEGWEVAYEAAKTEASRNQEALGNLLRRGEWLW